MNLLGITDLHDSHAALERILLAAGRVEVVLLGGDLTNFGTPAHVERIVRRAEQSGAKVLAVAGNCDSAQIDQRLVNLGVSLHGRGLVHQGVGMHGLSAMPPWRSDVYQFTETELTALLEAGYSELAGAASHVILSHAPPRDGQLDRTVRGQNVGSTALRAFVDQKQPLLVVCGHIHEGRGIDKLGHTTVVNCGPAATGFFATMELAERAGEVRVELRRA